MWCVPQCAVWKMSWIWIKGFPKFSKNFTIVNFPKFSKIFTIVNLSRTSLPRLVSTLLFNVTQKISSFLYMDWYMLSKSTFDLHIIISSFIELLILLIFTDTALPHRAERASGSEHCFTMSPKNQTELWILLPSLVFLYYLISSMILFTKLWVISSKMCLE